MMKRSEAIIVEVDVGLFRDERHHLIVLSVDGCIQQCLVKLGWVGTHEMVMAESDEETKETKEREPRS